MGGIDLQTHILRIKDAIDVFVSEVFAVCEKKTVQHYVFNVFKLMFLQVCKYVYLHCVLARQLQLDVNLNLTSPQFYSNPHHTN